MRACSVVNCQLTLAVALRLSSQCRSGAQRVLMGDAAGEALPPQRAQLDLSHVQPRAVLGRVVDLQPVRQALGLLRRERLVQAGRRVGVELVHDQHHPLGLAVAPLEQRADEVGPVGAAAVFGHRDMPPARPAARRPGTGWPRRCGYRRGRSARPRPAARQRLAGLADQLLEGLVQAHHRAAWDHTGGGRPPARLPCGRRTPPRASAGCTTSSSGAV